MVDVVVWDRPRILRAWDLSARGMRRRPVQEVSAFHGGAFSEQNFHFVSNASIKIFPVDLLPANNAAHHQRAG